MEPKDCFLILSGSRGDPARHHLFVVLTGPHANGQHVAVSFSKISQNYFCDDACHLEVGAHPFIELPSFVRFQKAIAIRERQLQALLESGDAQVYLPPVSDELLQRLRDGLLASAFTPPWLKTLYQQIVG